MTGRASVTIFTITLALLVLFATPVSFSNLVLAQGASTTEPKSMSPEAEALLKKLLSASSFSNIQTISFVDGIGVSGVNVGDSDITVTLKQVPSQNESVNMSTPVTVTAVRVPGSSIKDLMTLVEAASKLNNGTATSPLIGMLSQMGGLIAGLGGSNASAPLGPSQALLQLGQNTQFGVGNIVGGDWKTPRTVTTGLLDFGELFGMGSSNPSPNARAHFIMVFVVPYVGKTDFGSVPLN